MCHRCVGLRRKTVLVHFISLSCLSGCPFFLLSPTLLETTVRDCSLFTVYPFESCRNILRDQKTNKNKNRIHTYTAHILALFMSNFQFINYEYAFVYTIDVGFLFRLMRFVCVCVCCWMNVLIPSHSYCMYIIRPTHTHTHIKFVNEFTIRKLSIL